MNFIEDLKWREAIKQITDEDGLLDTMSKEKIAAYVGVDPTADSIHIGNLIPLMMLKRFQLSGHKAVILIGGGTGAIGDPSGKKSERKLLDIEQLNHNIAAFRKQFTKLFAGADFEIVNNADWLGQLSLLEFLRDYGKLFSVNTMIKKDIVATRLEAGISFTEFTYQILQGVDFYHLWQENNVRVQIGGSDQWGNITSGIDLIHSIEGNTAPAYGITIPLMLNSDGTKFGKSEGNAIFLDAEHTSPYEFYQFWLNQQDEDVVRYLKYFTFLSNEEIETLEQAVKQHPEQRVAQRRLAEEVTRFVHGQEAVDNAQIISQALFSGNIADLTAQQIEQAFSGVPSFDLDNQPINIVDLLVESGIESSKRQAREDVTNGAITINGIKQTDVAEVVDPAAQYDGRFTIIRRGKKKYWLGKVK